jgi:hypothetical protein
VLEDKFPNEPFGQAATQEELYKKLFHVPVVLQALQLSFVSKQEVHLKSH